MKTLLARLLLPAARLPCVRPHPSCFALPILRAAVLNPVFLPTVLATVFVLHFLFMFNKAPRLHPVPPVCDNELINCANGRNCSAEEMLWGREVKILEARHEKRSVCHLGSPQPSVAQSERVHVL